MSRLPPHRPLLFAATFKGFPAFAVATYLQRQGFARGSRACSTCIRSSAPNCRRPRQPFTGSAGASFCVPGDQPTFIVHGPAPAPSAAPDHPAGSPSRLSSRVRPQPFWQKTTNSIVIDCGAALEKYQSQVLLSAGPDHSVTYSPKLAAKAL
jgi:hypothetical protein